MLQGAHAHNESCEHGQTTLDHDHQDEYNILAISHSGTIRIVLENLVGDQLPDNVERESGSYIMMDNLSSTSKHGRLVVPNTSKSVIEFTMVNENEHEPAGTDSDAFVSGNFSFKTTLGGKDFIWTPKLIDCLNVSHLCANAKDKVT